MDDEQTEPDFLTPEQWVAARVFVALMGAEANEGKGDEFDFDSIGVEVMPLDSMVYAMTAEHQVAVGDMMYAAKMLLWSMICSFAEVMDITPAAAVSHLGMNLALVEPGT